MTNKILRAVLLAFGVVGAGHSAFSAETLSRYYAHDTVEDRHGVIAPWYRGQNGQFDYRVRIAAETLRRYPWVTNETAATTAPTYAYNNTWKISKGGTISIPDIGNWYNAGRGQGSARALFAWIEYYRYSGDPAAFAHVEAISNAVVDTMQTDESHPWPKFMISVPVAGKVYGQASAEGWIQLDIVAETAVALLRAYQLTGNERWLNTVKHWADVFAAKRNRTPGAAPWDRYANFEKVYREWGKTQEGNIMTGGIVYLLAMFDELIRLGYTGHDNVIIEARDTGREYLRDVLLPAWAKDDTWGRNYWDWEMPVQGQTITDWAVRYLMDNKDYFPDWRNDVRNILTLFLNHTSASDASKSEVYSGAWAFPESSSCCSSSLAWGPMEFALDFAQYAVETGDAWALEMARRQQILATYDVHDTGVVEDNIFGGGIAADNWMNSAVPSSLKWVLRTMGWLPELMGASRENHVMRTTATVNAVTYDKGRVSYSTFDAPVNTHGVLRLAFEPTSVSGDGKMLSKRDDLSVNGYTVKALPAGDYIVSIRHDGARNLVIVGNDPQQVMEEDGLQFKGRWSAEANAGAHGGSLFATSTAGAQMEFKFIGNQVRLVGGVGPQGGKADVYVDGVKQLVGIDYFSPFSRQQQILYYRNGLSQGEHTLRIVAKKDRNPLSKGGWVTVDAVQYSAAQGDNGFGEGGGPTTTQRMIFGYLGRQDYIDAQGNAWRPGTEWVVRSGRDTDTVAKHWWTLRQATVINGTTNPELYAYGAHAPDFTVNVTVGPGEYYVRVKLAENDFREINRRAMSIYVNDDKLVERMDVIATVKETADYRRLQQEQPDGFDSEASRRAVDLVFNGVKPRNGIIELRFVGETIGGFPTEAILNALEVGQGYGGEGSVPVTVMRGR